MSWQQKWRWTHSFWWLACWLECWISSRRCWSRKWTWWRCCWIVSWLSCWVSCGGLLCLHSVNNNGDQSKNCMWEVNWWHKSYQANWRTILTLAVGLTVEGAGVGGEEGWFVGLEVGWILMKSACVSQWRYKKYGNAQANTSNYSRLYLEHSLAELLDSWKVGV